MYKCKHCKGQIPSFDSIMWHACFINKAVFMEEIKSILYHQEMDQPMSCSQSDNIARAAESPQNDVENSSGNTMEGESEKIVAGKECAIWTKKATTAAISLYEANMEMLEHLKKKGKLWDAVQNGLINVTKLKVMSLPKLQFFL